MVIINNIEFNKFGETRDDFYSKLNNYIFEIIRLKVEKLPPRYSPDGIWDEDTCQDLVNEFIAPKLKDKDNNETYSRNRLKELFDRCSTEKDFIRMLSVSIGNFLYELGGNDESRKLYLKIKESLNNSVLFVKYKNMSKSKYEKWGLAEWADNKEKYLIEKNIYDLKLELNKIPAVDRKNYKKDTLSSPIVEIGTLTNLLIEIFKASNTYFTIPELKNIVETKINIFKDDNVSFNEIISSGDEDCGELKYEDVVSIKFLDSQYFIFYDTALVIYRRLSNDELKILFFKIIKNIGYVEISGLIGFSKTKVGELYNSAIQKIKSELEDAADYEYIIKILLELFRKNFESQSIDII